MAIRCRPALPTDHPRIVEFQLAMARETEGLTLDPATCAAGVRAVFDDRGKGRYFVAELDGEVIGSLLTVDEWSDWRNRRVWWIHSVYVVPEARGQGAFKALYLHLRGLVERDPALGGLRLYVDKRNAAAQQVYAKLGMTDEHYALFEWMK